ncbi:unnamed protein product [Gongylonema pulchrum]|uniref:MFS domain-containing protein n=1 Tax=Gongylonema pulchrum TaxID=637853 RepID=A0A183E4L0_9BILA|nr:unnamed protein product [Gongylonema pulchrum]
MQREYECASVTSKLHADSHGDLLVSSHHGRREHSEVAEWCGLAPNWKILLLSRFFVGLSIGGTIVGVCTYVMEMLLPEQRMALRAFFNWVILVLY